MTETVSSPSQRRVTLSGLPSGVVRTSSTRSSPVEEKRLRSVSCAVPSRGTFPLSAQRIASKREVFPDPFAPTSTTASASRSKSSVDAKPRKPLIDRDFSLTRPSLPRVAAPARSGCSRMPPQRRASGLRECLERRAALGADQAARHRSRVVPRPRAEEPAVGLS